jgi:hypothetical protein
LFLLVCAPTIRFAVLTELRSRQIRRNTNYFPPRPASVRLLCHGKRGVGVGCLSFAAKAAAAKIGRIKNSSENVSVKLLKTHDFLLNFDAEIEE